MSNTTTTQNTTTKQNTGGTIDHVDPATLIIDTNVRTAAEIGTGFRASIRLHGVQTPIRGWRDEDGQVHVITGQRRTLAAIDAGLTTVPVYVTERPGDDEQRVIGQLVENDQRQVLTERDRAAGVEQLAAIGLTAGQIAARAGYKRTAVKNTLAVLGNETSRAAYDRGLTLDQSEKIGRIENGDVRENLTAAIASGRQVGHEIQRELDKEASARAAATLRDAYEATGSVIFEGYPDPKTATPTRDLVDPDGTSLDSEAHATCPGRAVLIRVLSWSGEAKAEHFCTAAKANGHRTTWQAMTTPAPGVEDEQAREAAKAERREVRENNAAMRSAITVRREFLRNLLARKTAPKDAAEVTFRLTLSSASRIEKVIHGGKSEDAGNLLGVNLSPYTGDGCEKLRATPGAQATRRHLAVVLVAFEVHVDYSAWRYPDQATADYLTALAGWGYVLSDVEQLIIDARAEDGSPTSSPDDAGKAPAPVEDVAPETETGTNPDDDNAEGNDHDSGNDDSGDEGGEDTAA